jgi:hypothetical protein
VITIDIIVNNIFLYDEFAQISLLGGARGGLRFSEISAANPPLTPDRYGFLAA